MTGLYHTLNIGAESLYNTRQGVDTAGHNIANAQTEGYSRQRVNLTAREPSEHRGMIIGNGSYIENITRAHDSYLEKQLNQAHQANGETAARFDALKSMEGIFSPELNAGVGDELTSFFNAIQDLSNFPEELTVRTHVREAASNLAGAFKRVDASLLEHRQDLNNRVIGEVTEVNQIIKQIAQLNIDIGSLEGGQSQKANDLRDKQDLLLRDLNNRVEINYYRSDNDMLVVRGPQETLLVDRRDAAKLDVHARAEDAGMVDIVVISSDGNRFTNVTEANSKGRLKGLIDVRDKIIPGLTQRNNEMAKTFVDNFNAVHRQGFGLNTYKGTIGRDFFAISEDPAQAARSMGLAQNIAEDTDSISIAASPNAPGDNVMANELLRLQSAKIMGGKANLNEYYADYVGVFGLEIIRSDHEKQAQDILVGDLKARREAVSGVSMDEEAMNLMRWQSAFTASSRVITTVDEMLETVLSLKR